ncbi:glycerol-3-phosphate 1-O-acyltransferase PlsY [Pseudogemmobacter humi]|uniref:Glycerol-3-phosphate acyltransferase n=1 Tax=Pseudogemmobacter humi TaxID=2483812 RepID=A0A3P5XB14_9RHOB|nr:glycerol-3-phosphate 1-O-acyltransferase PlsY [Pseudogemmobacter humi]VDC28059.1 putative glycerol-3-phosphate acyltransferase [Pseudogemmobacter humi]
MPELITPANTLILTALLAYLLGSVPFGVVITKGMGLGDLRRIGSGNIGATNVLRTGSKGAALATLILDGAKGAVAVLLARWLVGAPDAMQLAGLAAFIGHLFPVWLKFKGGKGVATFLGTLIALSWPVGLAACATWLAAALVIRISSAAALVAAATVPAWLLVFDSGRMLFLVLLLTLLIYIRHWANLVRIRAGTEPKIGAKKG